jgi:hypothetical protein
MGPQNLAVYNTVTKVTSQVVYDSSKNYFMGFLGNSIDLKIGLVAGHYYNQWPTKIVNPGSLNTQANGTSPVLAADLSIVPDCTASDVYYPELVTTGSAVVPLLNLCAISGNGQMSLNLATGAITASTTVGSKLTYPAALIGNANDTSFAWDHSNHIYIGSSDGTVSKDINAVYGSESYASRWVDTTNILTNTHATWAESTIINATNPAQRSAAGTVTYLSGVIVP